MNESKRKSAFRMLGLAAILVLAACNLPDSSTPAAGGSGEPAAETQEIALTYPLPDPFTRFPPPPIVPVPRESITIGTDTFDAYQVSGDRFRVLCKQPCGLDERLIFALYAGYKISAQAIVRTAGFDVLDRFEVFDVHLDRDNTCTRYEGELGLTTSYPDDPESIVICLYITDTDLRAQLGDFLTPEAAVRSGGLGVFSHEYTHAILLGRFISSHDFVFPIEYVTMDALHAAEYADLCNPVYQGGAPFSYQLCQLFGFTFRDLLQSLLDLDRLYQGGFGSLQGGMLAFMQYKTILDNLLGTDVLGAVQAAGYEKILAEEGFTESGYPYAGEDCTYRAQFVLDVTVPFGSTLDANTGFEKTWRVLNAGSCPWDSVRLAFVRGEAMTETSSSAVPATSPGEVVDVTVPMTAPQAEGVHAGEWRLLDPTGQAFGPILNLILYTRPGCDLPPEISSFESMPSVIGPGAMSLLTWGQITNVDQVRILGLGEVDPNGGRILVEPNATTTYQLQAICGETTISSEATVTVDASLPPFALDEVMALAEPARYSGSCDGGVMVRFTGTFTSPAPGAVVYQWNYGDGGSSEPSVYIGNAPGVQTLDDGTFWLQSASVDGWVDLEILAPIDLDPVRADFSLACTP